MERAPSSVVSQALTVVLVGVAMTSCANTDRPVQTQSQLTADSHNVWTQHYDNGRSGATLSETLLNTSNVNVSKFGKLFTRAVDDQLYAQPLYLAGVPIAGGTHNVVYAATVNATLYAFDADDPAASTPLAQRNLVDVAPASSRAAKNSDISQCGGSGYQDFAGGVGIVGTPVIDVGNNTMYVVTRVVQPSGFVQRLHAVDVATLADRLPPVVISATMPGTGNGSVNGQLSFDAKYQNQRAALLLSSGVVYIAWASHCDANPYHGWVMGYRTSDLQRTLLFNTSPDGSGVAIWQSGQGLAADASGKLYFVTGNGTANANAATPGQSYGNAFMKLDPTLASPLVDWFMPFDVDSLNASDLDLGASGPLLIPGTNYVFGGGKGKKLYVVDGNNMGHFRAGVDSQIPQSFLGPAGHLHGSAVYWNGVTKGPTVYLWSEEDYLRAYAFNGTTFNTTPTTSTMQVALGMPGGMLSISANGNSAGSGIVWAGHPSSGDALHSTQPGIVRALDASDVTKELWNSNMNATRDGLGNFAKYNTPVVANGKVYMGTFSYGLVVYGSLACNPTAAPLAPAGLTATAGGAQVSLSWTASATATSYTVKRSTTSGSGFAAINSAVTTTSFVDTGLTPGTTYYYVVSATNCVAEGANSAQASATPTTPIVGAGTISFEKWTGIATGTIASIPLGNTPNATGTFTSFEIPTDVADYYGMRLRGYIVPPTTGTFTFWVASDDNSDLWLSTNSDPATKVKIASVGAWTNSREWNKYTEQKSVAISLVAGQSYYVEALMAEGNGGDNLAVGWAKPGEGTTSPSEVIPGTALSPFSGGCGASAAPVAPTGLTGTAGNAQASLSWTASAGAASYTVKRSATSGSGYANVAVGLTGTSYVDTGLTNGTPYYYVVTATNCFAESLLSTQASVVPTGCAPTAPPAAPTGLTGTAGNAQTSLSWTASAGAASYTVKRSTTSGSGYANVATGLTATSYVNTGLTNGTTYYYVVSATNCFGEGVNSLQVTVLPSASLAGLQGEYFDNGDFTNLKVTRTDSTLNFNWGTGSPDATMGVDTFSVRWTGQILPQYSQTYTFYTTADDGIRLWVNGVLIINNWVDQGATTKTGTIALTANTKVSIKVEYYENGGNASAKLEWSSSSRTRQVIPSTRLFH